MSSNDPDNNRIGPTVLWSMLKGKKVITNDGKDIGEIKDISDNYIRLEKGTIKTNSGFPNIPLMHTMVNTSGY
jgi:PRC-barrel domain